MEMEKRNEGGGVGFQDLAEDCVAAILSMTRPRDACRFSLVSSTFRSAAESDAVWEFFLPQDYQSITSSSSSSSSKKELYLRLCDNPVPIHDGNKSFSLDKGSGKKFYMLSARDLMIVWGDSPTYWRWTSEPNARFPEVAELVSVCWFEIRGKINTSMLSPETLYTAHLVFKSAATGSYGFEYQPVEIAVGLVGSESCKRSVYLDTERGQSRRHQIVPRRIGLFTRSRILGLQAPEPREGGGEGHQYPKERGDGWVEMELGEFFNQGNEDGELEMSVLEGDECHWKGGLTVQGIEIRPKQGK